VVADKDFFFLDCLSDRYSVPNFWQPTISLFCATALKSEDLNNTAADLTFCLFPTQNAIIQCVARLEERHAPTRHEKDNGFGAKPICFLFVI